MRFLGFSIEDWVALVSIIGSSLTVLIWGFKRAFHSVYEQESLKNKNKFQRLVEAIDDFKDTQTHLNETMHDIQVELNRNNSKLVDHEIRISKLETKEEVGKHD